MRRALLAAAAAVLALTACTDGGGKEPPDGDDPLPMIAIDACPAPETLLTRAEEPTKGRRLADVTLPCLGHEGEVRMRALGKVPTVVNLWGSWCFPCRTEMPEFQKVHRELGDKVRFLGVDTKDFERPARVAIQNAAITYANVFDKDERIKRSVNARSLPTTVLVGADGLVKNVHVGELTAAELRAQITKHLGV
ncbi:MAG TPA: TlpA disulfide reductase family protein [Frankiaceae bacterium]|nr:TlpA disulfide reductase family protein [Frankiaceae bacterium]